jgi:hypothetical protein
MALKIIEQIKQLPNNKGVVLLPIGSVHADRVAKKVRDGLPASIKNSVEIIVAYCPAGYVDKMIMKQQIASHTRDVGDNITMTDRFIYSSQTSAFAQEVVTPGVFRDEEIEESTCGRLVKKCVIL